MSFTFCPEEKDRPEPKRVLQHPVTHEAVELPVERHPHKIIWPRIKRAPDKRKPK